MDSPPPEFSTALGRGEENGKFLSHEQPFEFAPGERLTPDVALMGVGVLHNSSLICISKISLAAPNSAQLSCNLQLHQY